MKNQIIDIYIEKYRSEGDRISINIEKLFNTKNISDIDFKYVLSTHNWKQYNNKFIALNSSLIIPKWYYLILNIKLLTYAKKIVVGSLEDLETSIYKDNIEKINTSIFYNKSVIINGCKNKYLIPDNVYIILINKILPFVKSIMYGNICHNVKIYKNIKKYG